MGKHSIEARIYEQTHGRGDIMYAADLVPSAEVATTHRESKFNQFRKRVGAAVMSALMLSGIIGSQEASAEHNPRVDTVVETVVEGDDVRPHLAEGDRIITFAGTDLSLAQRKAVSNGNVDTLPAGPIPGIGPLFGQETMVAATDGTAQEAVKIASATESGEVVIFSGYSQGAIGAEKAYNQFLQANPDRAEDTVGVFVANPYMQGGVLDQNRQLFEQVPGLVDPEWPELEEPGKTVNVCLKWDMVCDGDLTVENLLGYLTMHNAYNGQHPNAEYNYTQIQNINPDKIHIVQEGNDTYVIVDAPRPSIAIAEMLGLQVPQAYKDWVEATFPNESTGPVQWDNPPSAETEPVIIPEIQPVAAEVPAVSEVEAPVTPAYDAGEQTAYGASTAVEQTGETVSATVNQAETAGVIDTHVAEMANQAIADIQATADQAIADTQAAYNNALAQLGLAPR